MMYLGILEQLLHNIKILSFSFFIIQSSNQTPDKQVYRVHDLILKYHIELHLGYDATLRLRRRFISFMVKK